MDHCIISGNIVRDAELKDTTGQKPTAVMTFTLAVNTGYGNKKKTSYLDCKMFGKLAESSAKYFTKGTKLLCHCEANQERWKDRDGNNVSRIMFYVKDYEFPVPKSAQTKTDDGPQNEPQQAGTQETPHHAWMDIPDDFGMDDTPFA